MIWETARRDKRGNSERRAMKTAARFVSIAE
jgi:hypothetical protein